MASGDRRKRLIDLSLEPGQEAAILRLLDDAGIAHQETRSLSRFFGSNAIWVADPDAILRAMVLILLVCVLLLYPLALMF